MASEHHAGWPPGWTMKPDQGPSPGGSGPWLSALTPRGASQDALGAFCRSEDPAKSSSGTSSGVLGPSTTGGANGSFGRLRCSQHGDRGPRQSQRGPGRAQGGFSRSCSVLWVGFGVGVEGREGSAQSTRGTWHHGTPERAMVASPGPCWPRGAQPRPESRETRGEMRKGV